MQNFKNKTFLQHSIEVKMYIIGQRKSFVANDVDCFTFSFNISTRIYYIQEIIFYLAKIGIFVLLKLMANWMQILQVENRATRLPFQTKHCNETFYMVEIVVVVLLSLRLFKTQFVHSYYYQGYEQFQEGRYTKYRNHTIMSPNIQF